MSSPTADEDAQIAAVVAASVISNYIFVAIIALLVYEWIIGLGKEINLFWREKITAATALFLLNRYAPLVYMLASFSGDTAITDAVSIYPVAVSFDLTTNLVNSCNASVLTSIALDLFQYVPWALFSGLRTYALCGKRWIVAIPVLVLSTVPIGINLTRFHWSHGEVVPFWGCETIVIVPANISLICGSSPLPPDVNMLIELYRFAISILPRASLIVADAIVVVVTWLMTYSSAATGGFSHGSVPSIAQRLLVNGTIYFVLLLILNVLHLSFTVLSIAVTEGDGDASYIVSFTEPITAILVARFMFDLQTAKHKSQHRGHFSDGTLAGTGFDRALGSIGSTLSTSDVWRLGPSSEPTSDHCDHAERSSGDLVLKFDSDVFGKGAVTSVILEPEPALQELETV